MLVVNEVRTRTDPRPAGGLSTGEDEGEGDLLTLFGDDAKVPGSPSSSSSFDQVILADGGEVADLVCCLLERPLLFLASALGHDLLFNLYISSGASL